ncbi:hypothetical protein HanXRQr2_Chr04g0145641 [Helianthus annuus]|uniref:Uncharacterized protein n=1 Tax=Helianthus annuus TaxID=4232 RepID=A0A9K3NQ23_HELAN|nr:hypothetical protein HanXRQr2_Chr04g0145641 [Helianthus annuus]KAJ0929704.1 hypothetical protein HanPSC8_Chr04g0140711 [Helianthus annuus]
MQSAEAKSTAGSLASMFSRRFMQRSLIIVAGNDILVTGERCYRGKSELLYM